MTAAAHSQSKPARSWASQLRRLLMAAATALLLCSTLLGSSPAVQAQISSSEEYRLKFAFLYNFARFVDWPADAFSSPQAPLNICIIGRDPFDSDLDRKSTRLNS